MMSAIGRPHNHFIYFLCDTLCSLARGAYTRLNFSMWASIYHRIGYIAIYALKLNLLGSFLKFPGFYFPNFIRF